MNIYDVLIVGAGPCGLACGIEAQKNGLSYAVLDKGSITESIRRYPIDMTFFSSADNIAIGDIPFPSLNLRPSRAEALKYYRKVVEHLKLNVKTFTEVQGIEQQDELFVLQTNQGEYCARKVILAIGYYDIPRELNIPGEDLPHVTHYYDEPYRYTGTKAVVVGGANSAIETALDLYRNGVDVTVVHQFEGFDKTAKYWIVPDIENRVKKNEVDTFFKSAVTKITEKEVHIKNLDTGEQTVIPADFVFLMVGYHPDAKFLRRVGVQLNGEMLIPQINPETYESNIPGIYMGGSVIGGEETAKVFIENGKLHAIPIIADIKEKLAKEDMPAAKASS
ncbi:YpdA family putative bacillithiol disulfide reductase [Porifericola rhodea]|uniref:YpdA family putative bacillithiol disulfide reductase n=1 Tax=Porifericola rhodea TaxID=930972 RepID=UPI0026656CF4|nr:YpdA family putative bacillithiol disulfide reductase [Porifericola rhodea]WKN32270.1 YpdA family putative bacillithiol disulfide reductase [Porifericola rhodea]